MSYDKHYRTRCDWCNKYCVIADSLTIYGAVYHSIDDAPEPHEPEDFCENCAEKLYKDFLKRFKDGYRGGDWMKSRAEVRAAKDCGLTWIHSPTLKHKETGVEVFNKYIVEKEREQYELRYPSLAVNR